MSATAAGVIVSADAPEPCNLSGDGTPEATVLIEAGHRQRAGAIDRVDAALPGFDAAGRGARCGLDTLAVLQVDPGMLDPAATLAAIDHLLSVGDLDQDRGLIVDAEVHRGRPISEAVRSPSLGPSTALAVDPFAAVDQLRASNTIVLNEAHRRVGPAAADLAEDLAVAFRSGVQVNAYASVGHAPGFGLHWDDHDVVVVQVTGRKYWEVHQPSEVGAVSGFTPRDGAGHVAWSGVVGPGQALAIPRGWPHRVEGLHDELSVHLTFSNRRASGIDLFERIHPDSATRAGRFGPDELEQCYGSWYGDLVGLPRNGPLELFEAQGVGYDGFELHLAMLGGPVFRPASCTASTVALRAGRRDLDVPRPAVAALGVALTEHWWTVPQLAAAGGLHTDGVVDLIALLGRAGLVHLRRQG